MAGFEIRPLPKMLADGKPDLVVAFSGGRGTAHMVKIALAAGVEVLEVQT